jgi:serine-type D-Ala-D-Ala carboxypeptidase/endopeptidase (penicillin-binding protein 4)
VPSPAALVRLFAGTIGKLGKGGAAEVVDVATGQPLYLHNAASPRTPASTTKLLSAVSVLAGLGPDATLTTKVVAGASPDQVILVGGGDIRLAVGVGSPTAVYGHAGLGDLATQTAAALKLAGTQRVSVGFDDSIFTGPTVNARWLPSDRATSQVGPITALGVAAAAARPGHPAPADPSLVAARTFATALARQGIAVTGSPRRVRAAAGATQLAAVQSATIGQLVDDTLTTSDNTEAEVLARLGAIAGHRPGSFAGAVAQNIRVAAGLGVPVTGVRLYDGSGLARADLIPPQTLAILLTKVAASSRRDLRAMFAGLPIGGFTGTLAPRFQDLRTHAGAGVVRAKTGTLLGVNSLAGIVVDADGRLLAFAFMASHPTAKTPPAVPLIDRSAAILAGCGCQ